MILLGDFNCEESEKNMRMFCETYNFKHLVKKPTCFKNISHPSCIDLILTNKNRSFTSTKVLETGLSDHHKLTVTVLKAYFIKSKPKTVTYRCFKNFDETKFRNELQNKLNKNNFSNCNDFEKIFLLVLDGHAPCKEKLVRANESPFMNKKLKNAIMNRSRIRNKYLKSNTLENKIKYTKIRNYCVNLNRKTKREYYSNINIKNVIDNKKFWNTVKPLFSDKVKQTQNITLIEGNKIISDKRDVAEKINNFFSNAVPSLNIKINDENLTNTNNIEDPILRSIKKYEKHPSIIKINSSMNIQKNNFSFSHVATNDIISTIKQLDTSKATTHKNIPIKIFKQHIDLYTISIKNLFNTMIKDQNFPNNLKRADITPVHKKGETTNMCNYRPVSILPTISKVFEKLLYKQINSYISQYLSNNLCGFRQGFSAQHCLIVMIEEMKKSLDKGDVTGALLTDLSKAFDCISHDLLIAKLHAYGFDTDSLRLIHSYLSERQQRAKIDSTFSSWADIIYGVPQGSILGPLLFNIFINDMFLFTKVTKITNYADDNTPYVCGPNVTNVINKLESDSILLLKWFRDNGMKPNEDKCKLLISKTDDKIALLVGSQIVNSSHNEKLLGITIDNNLNFKEHVSNLCKKSSQKLHALAQISRYMSQNKLKVIMKAFITSQFGYCPLVWMFHSRKLNNHVNKIHERALRLVYKDNASSFTELLIKDNSVTIHDRNLQVLATEIYKTLNNLNPKIMKNIFTERDISYNLRKTKSFKTFNVKTVKYGTETLSFRGPKTWEMVPNVIKNSTSLMEFKSKIKTWTPTSCECRLCRTYIPNLGFI